MKICFFGTYEKNYSRNQMIFNGLADLGIKYDEIHVDLTGIKIESRQHLSIFPVMRRILRKLVLFPIVIRNFKKILNCDVLVVAYPGHLDMPFGYIVAKLTNKPLLFDPLYSLKSTVTDDFKILDHKSFFAHILFWYEKLIFNMPDILIADTELQKYYYNENFQVPLKKIKIIQLGANDRIYNFSGYKERTGELNVVYYGRYNPMHGVEYIIEAARMCKKDETIKFIFVGDGQTFEDNYRLAKKYNLKNITFYKDKTEKDSLDILRNADIFLGLFEKSNTVNRSMPNKIIQGAALGKAVITQEGDVLKTIFTHKKDIYFCKAEDGESLAKAILILQKDPSLRKSVSLNAAKLYLENFTPKAIGESFLKICNEVVGNNNF